MINDQYDVLEQLLRDEFKCKDTVWMHLDVAKQDYLSSKRRVCGRIVNFPFSEKWKNVHVSFDTWDGEAVRTAVAVDKETKERIYVVGAFDEKVGRSIFDACVNANTTPADPRIVVAIERDQLDYLLGVSEELYEDVWLTLIKGKHIEFRVVDYGDTTAQISFTGTEDSNEIFALLAEHESEQKMAMLTPEATKSLAIKWMQENRFTHFLELTDWRDIEAFDSDSWTGSAALKNPAINYVYLGERMCGGQAQVVVHQMDEKIVIGMHSASQKAAIEAFIVNWKRAWIRTHQLPFTLMLSTDEEVETFYQAAESTEKDVNYLYYVNSTRAIPTLAEQFPGNGFKMRLSFAKQEQADAVSDDIKSAIERYQLEKQIGKSALDSTAGRVSPYEGVDPTMPEEVVDLICIDVFDPQFTTARQVNTTIRVGGKAWSGTLYKVNDQRLIGRLPSKAIYLEHTQKSGVQNNEKARDSLMMTFYHNSTLPEASKPLKSAANILVVAQKPGDTLTYNRDAGVFIDNQVHPGGFLLNIIVFGDDQLKLLEVR